MFRVASILNGRVKEVITEVTHLVEALAFEGEGEGVNVGWVSRP